ncbi:HNH endonuclease [Methylorubrum suomiense]
MSVALPFSPSGGFGLPCAAGALKPPSVRRAPLSNRSDSVRLPIKGGIEIILDADLPAAFYVAPWYPWLSGTGIYYIGAKFGSGKYRISVLLHRSVIGAPIGFEVDHINRDTLDNRRANLRIATASQNAANRGVSSLNRSGYRGVHLKNGKYWIAQIGAGRVKRYLGCFLRPKMLLAHMIALAWIFMVNSVC